MARRVPGSVPELSETRLLLIRFQERLVPPQAADALSDWACGGSRRVGHRRVPMVLGIADRHPLLPSLTQAPVEWPCGSTKRAGQHASPLPSVALNWNHPAVCQRPHTADS